MGARTLGTISAEGYACPVVEEEDGRVHFLADADVDADGANGQNGKQAAYKIDDSGSELLANGGMKVRADGKDAQMTAGVVRASKARATWHGKSVDCVVADRGPVNRIGELSIAAARALGMNPSPRTGGVDSPEVLYEVWPGLAAPGFELQPA